ncbi:hypothetical protein BKA69DRAFT_809018 [Paraphysoderma sedebokerense]|nr:hypothetical protein BKA69DRAFT_809018 [Paraphysoderma sedebokerense]
MEYSASPPLSSSPSIFAPRILTTFQESGKTSSSLSPQTPPHTLFSESKRRSPAGRSLQSIEHSKDALFDQGFSVHIANSESTCMSISPSQRDVVVTSRKGLFIIDLENPFEDPRLLERRKPKSVWSRQFSAVSQVQWNPHQARESWVASTSNANVLIWNLNLFSSTTSTPNQTPPSSPPTSTYPDFLSSPSGSPVERVLSGHSRTVTDLNWSVFQTEVLATCGLDSYTLLWDLRKPGKAVNSFCAWTAGVSQVKWNPRNNWILATAHEERLMLWDIRKGSIPMAQIPTHNAKIYSICWSPVNENEIATSSQDKTVKFWNIIDLENSQGVINTGYPVSKCQYTPFGLGVVTTSYRKQEPSLVFWSRSDLSQPAFEVTGFSDIVQDFGWRIKRQTETNDDNNEFQLITWSSSQQLKVSTMEPSQLKALGHTPFSTHLSTHDLPPLPTAASALSSFSFRDPPKPSRVNSLVSLKMAGTRRRSSNNSTDALLKNLRGLIPKSNASTKTGTSDFGFKSGELPLRNLKDEVIWVSGKYPNVKFEKVDVPLRFCGIGLYGPWGPDGKTLFVRITVRFPEKYPDNETPIFEFNQTEELSVKTREELSQELNSIAEKYVSKNRPCLEQCLRYLLGESNLSRTLTASLIEPTADKFTSEEEKLSEPTSSSEDTDEDESLQGLSKRKDDVRLLVKSVADKYDQGVPFPVVCGVSWTGNGNVVAFFSPLTRMNRRTSNASPSPSHHASPNHSQTSNPTGTAKDNVGDEIIQVIHTHPRSYDQYEMFVSKMRVSDVRSRNATDSSVHDDTMDEADDQDDIYTVPSLYFRPHRTQPTQNEEFITRFRNKLFGQPKNSVAVSTTSSGNLTAAAPHNRRKSIPSSLSKLTSQTSSSTSSLMGMGNQRDPPRSVGGGSVGDTRDIFSPKTKEIMYGIVIKDFRQYLPVSPDLAKAYTLRDTHPIKICRYNAQVARSFNRPDLAKIWTCAELILARCIPPSLQSLHGSRRGPSNTHVLSEEWRSISWGRHPFGRKMVDNIFAHFERIGDVQTLALLSCVFTEPFQKSRGKTTPHATQPKSSPLLYHVPSNTHSEPHSQTPYKTISQQYNSPRYFATSIPQSYNPPPIPPSLTLPHNAVTMSDSPGMVLVSDLSSPGKSPRRGSVKVRKESLDGQAVMVKMMGSPGEFDFEMNPKQVPLLNPDRIHIFNQYRLAYADLLFRWGLLEARAAVMKFVGTIDKEGEYVSGIKIRCPICYIELRPGEKCVGCERQRFTRCSICHLSVKGLTIFCPVCGHGGHAEHIRDWFAEGNKACPTGCGCKCAFLGL